jgi:hypothetical protein
LNLDKAGNCFVVVGGGSVVEGVVVVVAAVVAVGVAVAVELELDKVAFVVGKLDVKRFES